MYAWMKNWPQGVIVVPMAATTVSSHTLLIVACGRTAPCSAAPQSGFARNPATM